MTRSELTVDSESAGDATVLRPHGELNSSSYLALRDHIVKAGIGEPSMVIVDLNDLRVPTPSALAVLTSARWQLSVWPNVPVHLAASTSAMRNMLQHNGILRYCQCYPSVAEALDAPAGEPDLRRRVVGSLPEDAAAVDLARGLLARTLADWDIVEYRTVGFVVVTELVRNALADRGGQPELRLEYRAPRLTIAVSDDSDEMAVRHEAGDGTSSLSGLGMVASVAHLWGSSPRPWGGRVVWAVLAPANII